MTAEERERAQAERAETDRAIADATDVADAQRKRDKKDKKKKRKDKDKKKKDRREAKSSGRASVAPLPRTSDAAAAGRDHKSNGDGNRAELAPAERSSLRSKEDDRKLKKKLFEKELERLSTELVKLQYWVKHKGLRVVVLFEGRDAAGKGGVIKTIATPMNPRGCRVVALGTPTEREKTQWYFQRYVAHLPAAGEIVLFDRSWYNRAGVERVMGFCTQEEYREFLHSAPEFERMLVRSGIILIKYWFSVSDDVQEQRFRDRAETPAKRWKISPMDLEARARWVDFSKAKDAMFDHTDISDAPWWVVNADDKKRARLNCIQHMLAQIPYKDVLPKDPLDFPPRQSDVDYKRPPREKQRFVPEGY
jgi:polyphosphate kinase 2